jgi:hypothetical protein
MANYEPRPIMLLSKTLDKYQFLSGFITFDEGNNNSVKLGELEAGTIHADTNLLYLEDTRNGLTGSVKPLPPYTFVLDQKDTTVQFQENTGLKKTKVKTSSSVGHTLPADPTLYIGRPFILQDEEVDGNKAVIYGFLMDINVDDAIQFDNVDTISISKDTKDRKYTAIFMFMMNTRFEIVNVTINDPDLTPPNLDYSEMTPFSYSPGGSLLETKNIA